MFKCNSTVDPNCKIDQLFAMSPSLMFMVPTINNLINAGEQDYRSTYLEELNYFTFSDSLLLSLVKYSNIFREMLSFYQFLLMTLFGTLKMMMVTILMMI